jgi:hypothetical protein
LTRKVVGVSCAFRAPLHWCRDMELNKENQHIAMQWNDFTSIAADNGIF